MSRCTEALDRRFYPGVTDNWDDDLFREQILERLTGDSVVLDVGAGAGIVAQMNFRGLAGRICGIDLDPRVLENPHLDEAKVADGETIPYDDGTFDLVISDNVFEHLEHPDKVLAEIRRVLKSGGTLLFKTPNARHYMPLIARLTPHRFHAFVNRLRGREAADTFPTRYRANSRRAIERLAKSAGFAVERIDLVEGRPEYTRIFCPLYLLGIAYERLVNVSSAFAGFRIVLVATLTRPS